MLHFALGSAMSRPMRKVRRRTKVVLVGALVLLVGAYVAASRDFCGSWPVESPRLLVLGMAEGPLRAGAARVPIEPPFPIVIAGQRIPRPVAKSAREPLFARAVVVEVEAVRVGIVALDLLTVPARLSSAVRQQASALELDELWVVATHTHSSLGGYDDRELSEVAGTGSFRQDAFDAVVRAAVKALEASGREMKPARLRHAERPLELNAARSGIDVDRRLTRVSVESDAGPIAELVVFSAHPVLVGAKTDALSPDFPGLTAAALEEQGGVALVLQGAAGNASVADRPSTPQPFAARLAKAVRQTELGPEAASALLAYARVEFSLPRPDASRLVPRPFVAAAENLLCRSAPQRSQLSALQLGPVRLLGIPGEPTHAASGAIERQNARIVSLVDDYIGYVDTAEAVKAHDAESMRQYFGPELLNRLADAAAVGSMVFR